MKRGLEEEGEQIAARNSCRRRAQWSCYLGREMTPLTQHRGGRGALELQTAPPCSDHSHGNSGFWGEDWATSRLLISSSSKGVWVHRKGPHPLLSTPPTCPMEVEGKVCTLEPDLQLLELDPQLTLAPSPIGCAL